MSYSMCSCQQYGRVCVRTYHPPLLQGSWIPVQDRINHRDRLVGAPGRHPLCWSYLGGIARYGVDGGGGCYDSACSGGREREGEK